jgi:hypothetical protein
MVEQENCHFTGSEFGRKAFGEGGDGFSTKEEAIH